MLQDSPHYDLHANQEQTWESFLMLQEELELTPEEGCHYISAKIILPWEDKIARGYDVLCKHNLDGDVIGGANANAKPILDAKVYEGAGDEVAQLTLFLLVFN